MKKILLTAALISALLFAGCGGKETSGAEPAVRTPMEELLPAKAAPPSGTETVQFDNIKLDLPKAWRYETKNGVQAYIDDGEHCAYMFLGCVESKGLSPDKIIKQYLGKETGTEKISPLSEPKKDKNDVSYQTAMLSYKKGGNSDLLLLIISNEQDRFWVLKGESAGDGNTDAAAEALKAAAETAELGPAPVVEKKEDEDKDVITGHTVSAEEYRNYVIQFKKKNKFLLYFDKDNKNNEHFSGTYKVFRGKDAIKEAGRRPELGLTEADIKSRAKDSERNVNDFYIVVLSVDEVMRWGAKTNYKTYDWVFSGLLDSSGKIDMRDHLQLINVKWTPKE